MKHILFILSVFFCCSCSNEIFDSELEDIASTRTTLPDDYKFEIYGGALEPYYQYDCKGNLEKVMPAVISFYRESSGNTEPIVPSILNKPLWVDSIVCKTTMYNGMFAINIYMKNNTSSEERRGEIILKQPNSDKILSLLLLQESSSNQIEIKVNETFKNHYELIATAAHPVKKEVGVKIPLVVYNDGGELSHNAVIVIPEGEKTGSYIMDWNASPLVYYHGDIKGYKLHEGNIYKVDDIYTYTLKRYW